MPVFAPRCRSRSLFAAKARGCGTAQGEKISGALATWRCAVGHAHPAVTQAISATRPARSCLSRDGIRVPLQAQLAERAVPPPSQHETACSSAIPASGTSEAAIKLERMYASQRKIHESGHHRYRGQLPPVARSPLCRRPAARKIQAGFRPLVQGFYRVPSWRSRAVRLVGEEDKEFVAVLVEPVTGEGGVNIPTPVTSRACAGSATSAVGCSCSDEIQTGLGRTRQMVRLAARRCVPDVMTLAKGLGNGVPPSAPAWRAAKPRRCSRPARTVPPSAATRWYAASRWRCWMNCKRQVRHARPRARRAPARGPEARARRCSRCEGNPRARPDARHRARPPVQGAAPARSTPACSSTSPPTRSCACCRR